MLVPDQSSEPVTSPYAPVTELPWRATFQPDDQLPHGEYELRAVATDAGALTDPDPPVVVVRYADLTPPAAPVGVLARATGAQVGISWQANAEPDLAGYRVERLQGSGVWVPLQEDPLVATQTIDPDRPLGEQRYRVRAAEWQKRYEHVALLNALNHDEEEESAAVAAFQRALERLLHSVAEEGLRVPALREPPVKVFAQIPGLKEEVLASATAV